MKKLRFILRRIIADPRALALWALIALLVPNILLDITEPYGTLWKIANIALPAGVYMLCLAAWKRTGGVVLCMLPIMALCGFQIVLTYLYGESIIAVDMFLNVVTTNSREVGELLGNLLWAMVAVVLLYIPLIVWAIYSLCRKLHMAGASRRELALWGLAFALFGGGMAATASLSDTSAGGGFSRNIFPVNVCCNMAEAVDRAGKSASYPQTSSQFTFGAKSSRPASEREVYVMVVGETSRADNWQLAGYSRPTNPRLSRREGITFFRRAVSESNTTHKSVPMLLSHLDSDNFNCINEIKSIITAMKEAGFRTCFFSNQAPNSSYTEFFGNEAHDVRYTDHSGASLPYDSDMIPWVREALADTTATKLFIVLHSYGSHFLYSDRYPASEAFFKPDAPLDATPGHRQALINAYDNSIRSTDHFLDSLIAMLHDAGCPAAMLYSADHGEDIFDDPRERFLHASPNPTYWQLHVAMLAWVSHRLAGEYPAMAAALETNSGKQVSPQRSLFPTMMALSGVSAPINPIRYNLADTSYTPSPAMYLNDLNHPLPLHDSGLREVDLIKFRELGIE